MNKSEPAHISKRKTMRSNTSRMNDDKDGDFDKILDEAL